MSDQTMPAADALAIAADLLAREVACLDERRWDEWLALYTADSEYWVPAWVSEDALADDPDAAISHIYYASRAGLEDRVLRLRSGRSVASTPLKRTMHQLTNLLVLESSETQIRLRCSSSCHAWDTHTVQAEQFFGHTHYSLRREGGEWRIARKKIVLLNDTLPSAVDVYCL